MIRKNELVYICSPLSAPNRVQMQENMRKADFYAVMVSRNFHCRAIAPHGFLPLYLDDSIPEERKLGIEFGLSLLAISKAIVVCGNRISSGMEGEISKAKELGIPGYLLMEHKDGMVLIEMTQEERTLE